MFARNGSTFALPAGACATRTVSRRSMPPGVTMLNAVFGSGVAMTTPAHADFTGDIANQEQNLITTINKQLTEDIFNKAFANW